MSTRPTTLHQTHEIGQSIWYDNIQRGLLKSGELAKLVEQGVRGITSNPTIFEKAISGSHDYDKAFCSVLAASSGSTSSEMRPSMPALASKIGRSRSQPAWMSPSASSS